MKAASLNDADGQVILDIGGGNFCAGYKQKGNYHSGFKAGVHRFLIIAYRSDWSKRITMDYPHLGDFFKSFQEGKNPYKILSPCKISRPLSAMLHRLSKQSKPKTRGELGAIMKRFISKTLTRYDEMLPIELEKLGPRAKVYIDAHYSDSELNIGFLIAHLFTTGQTLRENFKKEYGKTPHAYLIEVRLRQAHYLLTAEDFSVKEVCRMVGYEDAKNFSLQFKKFFGYPPSEAKRN